MRIGVFGCGNMGSALVSGMKAKFPDAKFFLFTPSKIKAQELADKVGGVCLNQIEQMPRDLDWYLLAFKPQALAEFEFDFVADSKIISILAGVKSSQLISQFNSNKIVRLMPNTPSAIGQGANLIFLNSHFSQDEKDEIYSLLAAVGKIFPMTTEDDLDLTTAFSGSGPALIFELARIFEAQLNKMTCGRVPAKEIVSQTFFGSAALMNSPNNNKTSFEDLRNQVTSKKGVTYEALQVLEKNNLQELFSRAFEAAYLRVQELSK
jgi:pyrroline-5-carboxylate reductase